MCFQFSFNYDYKYNYFYGSTSINQKISKNGGIVFLNHWSWVMIVPVGSCSGTTPIWYFLVQILSHLTSLALHSFSLSKKYPDTGWSKVSQCLSHLGQLHLARHFLSRHWLKLSDEDNSFYLCFISCSAQSLLGECLPSMGVFVAKHILLFVFIFPPAAFAEQILPSLSLILLLQWPFVFWYFTKFNVQSSAAFSYFNCRFIDIL